MTDSNQELKFFWARVLLITSRSFLCLGLIGMSYVVSRQSYNFSHWIPHDLIRGVGVSYETRLWAEQNADTVLHFLGGLLLTLCIYGSRIPFFIGHLSRIVIFVSGLCIAAEILQLAIGRGFDYLDLLLGILGCFVAYLTIDKNK